MAAVDFPASPALNQVFTASTGSVYQWNGTVWVPVGVAGSQIALADTPPSSPTPGQMWWNSALGQLFIWYNDGSSSQWVPASPATTPGSLIQTVFVETGAMATGSTLIPGDDTIPQITEGNEYMTLAITRMSATSRLIIEVVAHLSTSAANASLVAALFQDSTANALAMGFSTQASAGFVNQISFRHVMTSGTTGTTTFRVRGGSNGVGTTSFNGISGARFYGGVIASSIVIQEVVP